MKHKGLTVEPQGRLFYVQGFEDFNNIIEINRCFSSDPFGIPVDRTGTVHSPLNYKIYRPWQVPTQCGTLDEALQRRVLDLCQTGETINVMWSGGIDSTTAVTAFLRHAPDLAQIKIFYSPFSVYEHNQYLDFLKQYPQLECIDTSGENYMTQQWPGIWISGDGGDELNASLDDSFLKAYGTDIVHRPWKEFFHSQQQQKSMSTNLIEFAEKFYSLAGRPINTVLEARWFFYATMKLRILMSHKYDLLCDYPDMQSDRVQAFFDCDSFESWVYFNTDKIFAGSEYRNWKQYLKDYCYEHDGLADWRDNKVKRESFQLMLYTMKKTALQDNDCIFILDNGHRVRTPGLPLWSGIEFDRCYGTNLDYLFNEPKF